jgi:small subunit ribosomal protein S16
LIRHGLTVSRFEIMLTIRFARVGKKNKAQFKIMLQEHTFAPGGRHVEVLGSYDPHKKVAVLKEERLKYWLEKGAKASDTVHNLLVSKGIICEKKRAVKIPKKIEEIKTEEVKEETKAGEVKKEAKTEDKVVATPEIKAEKLEEKKEDAKAEDTRPEDDKKSEVTETKEEAEAKEAK